MSRAISMVIGKLVWLTSRVITLVIGKLVWLRSAAIIMAETRGI